MPRTKQSPPKTLNMTLSIMKLTGIGIIASGVATAVLPEMRTIMIPTFAVCATILGITLLSMLSKPKVRTKAPRKEQNDKVEPQEEVPFMDSPKMTVHTSSLSVRLILWSKQKSHPIKGLHLTQLSNVKPVRKGYPNKMHQRFNTPGEMLRLVHF